MKEGVNRKLARPERAALEELLRDITDEEQHKLILETVKKYAIAKLDNLMDAEAADGVLCGPDRPLDACPKEPDVEEYDQRLVDKVLRPLGCGDDADPAIAVGLARRAIGVAERERARLLGPLLAEALLDPKCAGGAALPEETKARLKKIAAREKAADRR